MKEKLTNNLVLKIASVLFAIIVWLIVLNINDPNKTVSVSNIPVEIINDDAITNIGKAYTIKSGATCTIKISGPRSIVDKLYPDDFTAVADIKDLSLTNSVPIEVELKSNTYKSKVDISVETYLKLEIEDVIEKEYEVTVEYVGEPANNYVVTSTQLENALVTIKAPRSQMDKIKSVVTVIDVSGKNDDFEAETKIVLKDIYNKEIDVESSEIQLSQEKVKSSSIVLYKKNLTIAYELPNAIDFDTLISEHSISIKEIAVIGRKPLLDGITKIELPIDLDEYRDVEEDIELKFNVDSLLIEGIYNYTSVEEIVLSIKINQQEDKMFTTRYKNILISNIPEDFEASLVTKGEFSFTIRGDKQLVDEVSIDDIIMKIEVGDLEEGNHNIQVIFTLPEGIEVLNDVYVEVSLAKKEENSSEDSTDGPTQDDETNSSENETTNPEDETTSSNGEDL